MSSSLFSWPNGFFWRLLMPRMAASRRRRFDLFMAAVRPEPTDRLLDAGVGEGLETAVNFLEDLYPYPERITALALEDVPSFRARHPEIKLVQGDARALPFIADSFDIYFSNAVLEHVGNRQEQQRFIHEACRVARRVFISTPNRWFPVDFHTLIPLAHYLPRPAVRAVYRFFGKDHYAEEQHLRLLGRRDIEAMLPAGVTIRWYPQRILGLVSNLNFLIERA